MSTAEAAASLFGSDDAASDLFASLGTDSDPSPSFGPDTSAYPAENAQPAQANSWTESSHYGQQSSSYLSDDGVFAPPVEDLKNTTGTGHAQWQQHDQQTYTGYHPAEVQDTAPAAVYDPGANYNPYAPTASHSVPATPPGQLTYHHYAPPPVNQSYAAPSAPISTSSQSAYSAYTPATPSTTTYTSPYSVANTPYVSQKAAVVPPPPAPAPVLNRPKLSNAYDPPFPTSRPSRRGVSASARSSAYNAYSQAPLPPPLLPSGGQFTPSGYALPPPLPSESPKLAGPNLDYRGKVDFHSNAPLYNPDAGNVSNAPPPRATPDSFAHQPSGEISHPSSSTSFVSGAQVAAISDMRVLPANTSIVAHQFHLFANQRAFFRHIAPPAIFV
ncbi:hypothetical protein B0H15DRAFT_1008283 [Mycena belliarum]|uniref:Uncharacterized protein n=1 Tax=Mycena belliarum TaxID=1033014 RepID=A0AAD6UCX6_9AGAR|nr:hypothetical protein B0H15DRAFT_1008283 [Mycena belliae]